MVATIASVATVDAAAAGSAAQVSAAALRRGSGQSDDDGFLEATYTLRTRLSWDDARLDVVETVVVANRSVSAIESLSLSVLARAYGERRVRSVRVDGRPARVSYPEQGGDARRA